MGATNSKKNSSNSVGEYLEQAKSLFQERWESSSSAESWQLTELKRIRTLGTGSFGTVILAYRAQDDTYYALKVLDKVKILKMKQVEHTINEKKILYCVDFPFIVKLHNSFKDNSYLYLVLEYVEGGEMFSHLRRCEKYPETQAKFYAAQVILAFEYLHHLSILYRDLKPENILITSKGYIKITDLGFAKYVKSRTWTLCGTPEYLAPEIILSKGYSKPVDWWSLGVLIYEMVAGYPPFTSEEPIEIYELIVACKIKYLQHMTMEVRDLIKHLVQPDLSKRFGILRNGIHDIKNHKWFAGQVEWLEIFTEQVFPPYLPELRGNGDSSHFDQYKEVPLQISKKEKGANEFLGF